MDQRVIVNFSPETIEAMSSATQYEEIRRTDVINRAVQLYDYLKDKEVYVVSRRRWGFGIMKRVKW